MKYILIISMLLLFACSKTESANGYKDNLDNNYKKEILKDNNLTNKESLNKSKIDTYKDLFSNKKITFSKLYFGSEVIIKSNSYKLEKLNVIFTPPQNSIKISDKEKEDIINKTGYGKNYFYTDSLFIEEKTHITALLGYMKKDETSLDNFIAYIMKMKDGNNIVQEYYILNGRKNIQFKVMLKDTLFLYIVFEAQNNNYLVLQYSFPLVYIEDALERIADSLNSIEYVK